MTVFRAIIDALRHLGEPMDERHPTDMSPMLDERAKARGLKWRTSVVDLLETVGVDSSMEHRAELAAEFGRSDYSGSEQENVWLHGRLMQSLREHGGRTEELK